MRADGPHIDNRGPLCPSHRTSGAVPDVPYVEHLYVVGERAEPTGGNLAQPDCRAFWRNAAR